jgi:hypothetical protein
VAKAQADIRSLARAQTEAALKVLTGVMGSKSAPPSARVVAAQTILDRGWGKAPQQLVGEDGGDIKIIIRQIIETATVSDDALVIEHQDGDGPATTE